MTLNMLRKLLTVRKFHSVFIIIARDLNAFRDEHIKRTKKKTTEKLNNLFDKIYMIIE
jgi:hypothetical protein